MTRAVIARLLAAIPVLFGVTVLVFVVLRILPGDPVSVLLAGAPATPREVAALQHQFGLDQPLIVQYWEFVRQAAEGSFGTSYATRQGVASMIAGQIGATIQLTLAAALLTAVAGVAAGTLAAAFRDTWIDALIRYLSLLGTSMPSFWTGILLLTVFSFTVHLFPATGSGDLQQLVLPAVTLALAASGVVTRVVRNSVIEVLGENFVTALRAKGISERAILTRHVLRNAIIPAVTIIGLQIGALLAGAVIVEDVFARQGLGRLLVTGVQDKDYPVIQGTVLVIAVIYVLVNIVVDISYAYLDPRIRSVLTER